MAQGGRVGSRCEKDVELEAGKGWGGAEDKAEDGVS